jgi:hypothetical protein
MRINPYATNSYSSLYSILRNRNKTAAPETGNAASGSDASNNANDLRTIERTRVIPKAYFRPYQETWNSHCSYSGDFDMSDVDGMASKLADKFVEQGFVESDSNSASKSTDYKQGMAAILAVYKARVPMQAKEIGEILKDNGITIEDGESYDFRVNKQCEITVTGSDPDKAQKIQDVLNNSDQLGWKLNRLTNIYSPRYDVKDGDEYDRDIFNEMQAESTIKELSGGKLSMSDLSIENGKIVGLPPELDELIHRTKPGMDSHDKTVYGKIYTLMKGVLERGLDNIPDLHTEARYEDGKLTIF